MNCPKCRKEMERGCLNTGGYRLLWSRDRNRMSNWPVEGDVVLLSPACAAFDKFKNFMVRGKFFKKLVMEL